MFHFPSVYYLSTTYLLIDFMIWTRGSSELWDHYAETTGDNGWSWDAMEPYWKKVRDCVLHFTEPRSSTIFTQVSTFVEPTANPSATPPADDPTLSNGNGPVLVNLPNWPTPLDSKAGNASKLLQETDSRYVIGVTIRVLYAHGLVLDGNIPRI